MDLWPLASLLPSLGCHSALSRLIQKIDIAPGICHVLRLPSPGFYHCLLPHAITFLRCSTAEALSGRTDRSGWHRFGNVGIGMEIPCVVDLRGRTVPALEVSK